MQQLEMFPDDIRIECADPDANMYRFYRLRLMPDLFGGVSLLRKWGRIGLSCSKMLAMRQTLCWTSTGPSRIVDISSQGKEDAPPALL